uniref:magnesium-protoporphyrin IX monomethyl ester (oxidative) cyclase n=1 Tax=Ananas comosus var. bracteatus TaxID=296719 RepID=A0A6V7PRL6_ANACO|nr:unnamed protein product [Ananas comosus var. bracteatus]
MAAAAELSLIKPVNPIRPFGRPVVRHPHLKFRIAAAAAAAPTAPQKPKKAGKTSIKETLLTPRFYTTDFDEMERLFNTEINKKLNQRSSRRCSTSSRRTTTRPTSSATRSSRPPPTRCRARSGRSSSSSSRGRAPPNSPASCSTRSSEEVVAEIFSLMSRDEARHAGFLNKGLSDFNLALDLGFLTKARKYTFFKPKFIFYATYLSEKIGYWRYITIFRHLKENPEYQCYPIFKYFENWCQDENRHGDFFSALLKAQPQFLNDWKAKLWARFFCLSVYVTMYLNDCQRTAFYEGIGLNTKEFDMHVIIETNRTTARIFPAVLDVENPEFKRKLDRMVEINQKLVAVGRPKTFPL